MDFDDVLTELGEMGKYQIKIYILICFPIFFAAANSLTYIFTAGVPSYRCFIPNCENDTYASYNTSWLQMAIPYDETTAKPSQCRRYKLNVNQKNATCTKVAFANETEECSEWIFDKERTIVNDWKITCSQNQWKLSLVGSSHFAGVLVGSATSGILADRYGRKPLFIFSILLMCVTGILQVVSPGYKTFMLLVFINAFGTAGVYLLGFMLGIEMVGRSKRELAGIVINYFYSIGEASIALISWIYEDWVILQLVVSAPCVLFVIYYWLIPESARWLSANKKKQLAAKDIIERMARYNNVKLSEAVLISFEMQLTSDKDPKLLSTAKLFLRSKKLVIRFTIVILTWIANSFVYYGLSQNSISVNGNKYLNFAFVSLVEILGNTMSWICMKNVGRRATLLGSFLLCGIACIISALLLTGFTWTKICLLLIGKFGISSSFTVAYVHTSEMMPTNMRSAAIGTVSTISRFGASLAPFIPLLDFYVPQLPMIIFGCVAVIAGLLSLILPETLGLKLPESFEDAEKI